MRPNYAPWYVIAWRLIWIGPVYASLTLFCVFIAAGWGWRNARSAWRTAR